MAFLTSRVRNRIMQITYRPPKKGSGVKLADLGKAVAEGLEELFTEEEKDAEKSGDEKKDDKKEAKDGKGE